MSIEKGKPTNPELYREPKFITRAQLHPKGAIDVYRITTEDIQDFVSRKVAAYAPGGRAEILVEYCEKRGEKAKGKQNISVPKGSYAALLVALSAETIHDRTKGDTLRRMVESDTDVKIIDDIYTTIILKYGFNRKKLIEDLNNYKRLDELEEAFGITEDFVRSILKWSTPFRKKSEQTKDTWVMFAARPEAIIYDMLTEVAVWEPKSNPSPTELARMSEDERARVPKVMNIPGSGPAGRMNIVSVSPISKESYEFTVHVHVNEFQASSNPELRKMFNSFK